MELCKEDTQTAELQPLELVTADEGVKETSKMAGKRGGGGL